MNKEEFHQWLRDEGMLLSELDEIPDLREGHEGEMIQLSWGEPEEDYEDDVEAEEPTPQVIHDNDGKVEPIATSKEVKYLWKSQYYEFGELVKKLYDMFAGMDFEYEKKREYLTSLRMLFRHCVEDTLKWEIIQPALFTETDMMDYLDEIGGSAGEYLHSQLSFQFVCIQLAQWDEEEKKEKDNQ